jgi:hypothetical protein
MPEGKSERIPQITITPADDKPNQAPRPDNVCLKEAETRLPDFVDDIKRDNHVNLGQWVRQQAEHKATGVDTKGWDGFVDP